VSYTPVTLELNLLNEPDLSVVAITGVFLLTALCFPKILRDLLLISKTMHFSHVF